jgi:hypothetical protein
MLGHNGKVILTKAKQAAMALVSETVIEPEGSPFLEELEQAEAFEEKLKSLLADKGSMVAGKLHFIDLSALRDRFADRWEKLGPSLRPGILRIIEGQLGPEDKVSPYEDAFIIVFPGLSKSQAQEKCAAITRVVTTWLLGKYGDKSLIHAKTVVARIDGNIDFERISVFEALNAKFEAEEQNERQSASPAAQVFPGNVNFIYRSMWNARNKIVSSYVCTPTLTTADGRTLMGDNVIPADADTESVAMLDLRAMQRVLSDHKLQSDGRTPAFLSFPVHFSTIADGDLRAQYLSILRQVPKPFQQLMVLELVGLPLYQAEINIALVVSYIRHLVRAVSARFSLDHTEFAPVRRTGIVAVGVDLAGEAGNETALMAKFDPFVNGANLCGLRTYIRGLPSLSLTTAAVCAGFTHFDGDAVASLKKSPDGVYPLDASRIYAEMFKSRTR